LLVVEKFQHQENLFPEHSPHLNQIIKLTAPAPAPT
jgi:hypothetical protein